MRKAWSPVRIWTAIAGFRVQSANRYTTGPADGSDGARDLSHGSSGSDQVLQHTVRGPWRLKPEVKRRATTILYCIFSARGGFRPAVRTSHSTLHLKACKLFSPHLSSSHLIPSLLTCHQSKFNCFHLIRALVNLSHLFEVLQSLHKALPSTTLNYKACTKHFPVLLCPILDLRPKEMCLKKSQKVDPLEIKSGSPRLLYCGKFCWNGYFKLKLISPATAASGILSCSRLLLEAFFRVSFLWLVTTLQYQRCDWIRLLSCWQVPDVLSDWLDTTCQHLYTRGPKNLTDHGDRPKRLRRNAHAIFRTWRCNDHSLHSFIPFLPFRSVPFHSVPSIHPPIHAFIHLFIHSFIHSLLHSICRFFSLSLIPSFLQSLISSIHDSLLAAFITWWFRLTTCATHHNSHRPVPSYSYLKCSQLSNFRPWPARHYLIRNISITKILVSACIHIHMYIIIYIYTHIYIHIHIV